MSFLEIIDILHAFDDINATSMDLCETWSFIYLRNGQIQLPYRIMQSNRYTMYAN